MNNVYVLKIIFRSTILSVRFRWKMVSTACGLSYICRQPFYLDIQDLPAFTQHYLRWQTFCPDFLLVRSSYFTVRPANQYQYNQYIGGVARFIDASIYRDTFTAIRIAILFFTITIFFFFFHNDFHLGRNRHNNIYMRFLQSNSSNT